RFAVAQFLATEIFRLSLLHEAVLAHGRGIVHRVDAHVEVTREPRFTPRTAVPRSPEVAAERGGIERAHGIERVAPTARRGPGALLPRAANFAAAARVR